MQVFWRPGSWGMTPNAFLSRATTCISNIFLFGEIFCDGRKDMIMERINGRTDILAGWNSDLDEMMVAFKTNQQAWKPHNHWKLLITMYRDWICRAECKLRKLACKWQQPWFGIWRHRFPKSFIWKTRSVSNLVRKNHRWIQLRTRNITKILAEPLVEFPTGAHKIRH